MGIRKYISEQKNRILCEHQEGRSRPPITLVGVLLGVVAVGFMYFSCVAFVRFRGGIDESFIIQMFAIISGAINIMACGMLNGLSKREKRTIEWYEQKLRERHSQV